MSELFTLRIEGLKRNWADFQIAADFSIPVGARAVLTGPSGSGKTTLIRLIAGLEKMDEGKILYGEHDLSCQDPSERQIGLVFQDLALIPSLNVLDNVTFGLRMRAWKKQDRDELGMQWINRLGLAHRSRSKVTELSGGESQRVAWARALIWKPRIILLDEPFSSLDTDLRKTLRKQLLELHELWPAPMLMVSHDDEDASQLATQSLTVQTDGLVRRIVSR